MSLHCSGSNVPRLIQYYALENACRLAEFSFFSQVNDTQSSQYGKLRDRNTQKPEFEMSAEFRAILSGICSELNLPKPDLKIYVEDFKEHIYTLPRGYMQDPYEKTGVLVCESVYRQGLSEKKLTLKRPFRLTSMVPPVLCNFSFYAQYADDNINVVENNDSGEAIGLIKPLVLTNEPCPVSANPEWGIFSRGFIFIGNQKLILNLSRGASATGEAHLLYPFVDLYKADQYKITGANIGFSAKSPEDPAFKEFYTIDYLLSAQSSWLHLYGTPFQQSPSIVLGNIFRRYLQPRALIAGEKTEPILLPWVSRGAPDYIETEIAASYSKYMSQIITEPYNSGLAPLASMPDYTRLIPPADFNIFNHFNDKIFSGNIAEISDPALMAGRATFKCRNAEEFFRIFTRKTQQGIILNLENNIVFVPEGITLPYIEAVAADGMLICNGIIETAGIKKGHNHLLTIISTSSDIITSAPVDANLAALSGKIFPMENTVFEIHGFYACNNIKVFSQGGRIHYPATANSLSPNDPYRAVPVREVLIYE